MLDFGELPLPPGAAPLLLRFKKCGGGGGWGREGGIWGGEIVRGEVRGVVSESSGCSPLS